ncbi:SusE domain-containing protein [Pseudopedobacter saltans]|nr:SusE domain-containing protein [Pseudopedobacter saltans]
MEKHLKYILILFIAAMASCKSDIEKSIILMPSASSQNFSASHQTIVLNSGNKKEKVVTFTFNKPNYGVELVPSYTLQFALPADTSGANAWTKAINVRLTEEEGTSKAFLGEDLNAILATQMQLETGINHKIVVRLKTDVNQNSGLVSNLRPLYSKVELNITPFEDIVVYPALLVKGGNSWQTPSVRTNGLLLASSGFNAKYEGYLNLPNADGWGGDAFTLISTTTGVSYGWGTSSTTIAEGSTGNLWLTPSPAYMKVNVNLDALTINYQPVTFSLSGDHNSWSTSDTKMTLNTSTQQLELDNVTFAAGNVFAFIANGNWNIAYKVNDKGKLVFAGDPVWGGINIKVETAGIYKVILDLSGGDGNYTYQLIKK